MSINLRKLDYSPTENPLYQPQQLKLRKRTVKAGRTEDLINSVTGEISAISAIHQIKDCDDEEFVKVFADGVAASYELTKTAQRVFQVVLDLYQQTPMSRGYADSVDLFWFGDGIEGRDLDMSEKTFQRGLKELLEKKFISPKTPSSYWVNPSLFFKGNRVLFIKEYRRRANTDDSSRRMQKAVGTDTTQTVLADSIAAQDEQQFINNATQHIDHE